MSQYYSQELYDPEMTVPAQKKRRYTTVATTKRRPDGNTIKHAATSRPVSLVPRNPALRPGYQATHLGGVNQRQKATIQFFAKSASQVSIAANTFSIPLKIQMNGAYDPDAGFSAVQPAAFAKYMQWYTKCCVTAAKVKVTLNSQPASTGANASTPFVWGLTLLTNNTSPSGIQEAITGGPRTYTMQFANPDVKSLTQRVDVAKYLGVNDLENNPDYACTSTANPAQLVVSQLWLDNNTGGILYFSYVVEVVYDVIFYDPQIIT